MTFSSTLLAAHIHFEEFFLKDVTLNSTNPFYEWTFDLENDDLYFWYIEEDNVQNQGFDFVTIEPNQDINDVTLYDGWFLGRILPGNDIHYAYLTMRFTSQNHNCCHNGNCSTCDAEARLILDNSIYGDYTIDGGNVFNNINVLTYVEDDHKLIVKLQLASCSGGGCCGCCDCDIKVDWVKISGCFECDVCDPIPEPSTIVLLGIGMFSVVTIFRRKLKRNGLS